MPGKMEKTLRRLVAAWPRLWRAAGCRAHVVIAAAVALVTLQLAVPLADGSAPGGLLGPIGAAVKAGLGAWALLALLGVGVAMVPGRSSANPHPRNLSAGRTVDGAGSVIEWWHLGLAAVAILGVLLARTPARFVVNVIGYLMLTVPLAWAARRSAGPQAARTAAVALAVGAVLSTATDMRVPPAVRDAESDSPFRWAVGWPSEGWVLRHEIQLPAPAERRAMTLSLPLSEPYAGPARVSVAVNGHDLGHAVMASGRLETRVPAEVVAGQPRLVLDLRVSSPDPRLRVIAARAGRGATLGMEASSYFDTQRWQPGTFNDAAGRRQPGIYVVILDYT